ncbi:hypothetical protein BO85DRAFT_456578 [Aspergillus piperis CBS 112811]|uniref:Uncharacterized protein n=2 Tax=Aspergillus subgen. Circumdati TaxID=2720871 RepID=A0A8G1VQH5_9EURO|nr:hypothetical protein BO85DRAFT_456578 [Aspergillus piperis CBS 112811]OJZ88023.1 hypothetical protein ASPFODRAFT_58897 [Aspergillus luchuensis CBS 106.47]RAH60875.1 hypothetical protein BO85DRAFT_456578 [Aspergillus piperis CBS 112811]
MRKTSRPRTLPLISSQCHPDNSLPYCATCLLYHSLWPLPPVAVHQNSPLPPARFPMGRDGLHRMATRPSDAELFADTPIPRGLSTYSPWLYSYTHLI